MAGGQTARGLPCPPDGRSWPARQSSRSAAGVADELDSFTALPSPLIPLGYLNATVSPVHCEVSIPLNPKVSGTPCVMYVPR